MTGVSTTGTSGSTSPVDAVHWSRWPWWVQVLALHLVARVVSAAVLVAVARTQAANPWTEASPSYLEYAGLMWDAGWYRQIAEGGYPQGLPVGDDGQVTQNAWAFFPLFPLLVRPLLALGVPWHVAAPVLAAVLGALAVLVLHRLVVEALDEYSPDLAVPARRVALATVVLVTVAPAAPVLQVAYTESLALLLLVTTLLLLVRRQYVLAVPVVLALGLTRAIALPVAAAVLLHGVTRWRAHRSGGQPWPTDQRVGWLGLGAATAVAGVLWPAIVAVSTGELDAYTRTQAAWRGTGGVVPVRPWLLVAEWLMGPWGLPVLVLLVAAAVAIVLSPAVRRTGPEMQGWLAGYLAYLLVVLEPGTSLVRFGLLAFPFGSWLALVALSRPTRWARRGLLTAGVVVGLLGQVAWIALLWRLVPPSGWPP